MPAFNEKGPVYDTVCAVKRIFDNVVVVDDHSSDTTSDLAVSAGAVVLRHPINLGQGAALQTGIDYALARGATEIVTFDSDGQHDPADALKMLSRLRSEGVDIVLGSRFRGQAVGITSSKQMLLKLATVYTRFATGLDVTDTHNGLRVLDRVAAQTIRIRQNRMAHASEILKAISDHKLAFVEEPCSITYSAYSKAKGQRMTGAFTILADLIIRRLYR